MKRWKKWTPGAGLSCAPVEAKTASEIESLMVRGDDFAKVGHVIEQLHTAEFEMTCGQKAGNTLLRDCVGVGRGGNAARLAAPVATAFSRARAAVPSAADC